MCEETSVSMSRAIATWGGAGWTLCLEGLPVEWRAIQKTLLLSTGRQRAPVSATMCGVLSTDVAQAVTARHRTSAESRGGKKKKRGEEKVWKIGSRYGKKENDGAQRLDKENAKMKVKRKLR